MPRAFDRRTPPDDHSPLANQLDFSDIDTSVLEAGTAIRNFLFDKLDEVLDAVVDFIFETTGIDLSDEKALLELLLNTILDTPEAAINFVRNILAPTGLLLGPGSPLNPAKLNENLWPLGIFPEGSSVSGDGVWVWDSDVTRTEDGSGSVRVTADGTMKALLGVPTAVVANQQMSPSVFVRWAGYAGTAAPIQLQIVEYLRVGNDLTRVGEFVVTSLGPTTASTTEWAELTGLYTAPESGVNEVRGRLVVTPEALAGSINWDDANARNKLLAEWISDLPEGLQAIIARIQSLLDLLHNTLTGSTDFGHTAEELIEALKNIPDTFVRGVLGPGTMGGTILKLVDAIVSGAVGESGEGAQLPDVETFIGLISSWATQGRFAWEKAGIRNNQPVDSGMLPSERSNFPLSAITTQFTLAPGTSLIAFDYIEEDMPLGAISWIGWGVSGITAFYVNVYRVDLATGGVAERIHASPNVVGILSGTASPGAFMQYEPTDPPAAVAGDLLAYELITVGGNHTIRGNVYVEPARPAAPIEKPAATRVTASPASPPSSIAWTDITWTGNRPWIGIAVDTGSSSDHHDPFQQVLTGPTTLPVASWANVVDGIVVGEGGDGAPGVAGFYGNPATPGSFATVTWMRDTHFTGPTILTWDGTTLSVPGFSIAGSNGNNGSGVRAAILGKPVGPGPGVLEYNGLKAIGGDDQTAIGGDGTVPGGAGNGGSWFGIYSSGGHGGPARAWVQFRMEPEPGEDPGSGESDTTAPNIDALDVDVEATVDSFTLIIDGAVDE